MFGLGLGDISHAICMRISSVKPIPWLEVNLHHLFSNGAAFNTQSRRSLTSDAISLSLSQMNHLQYKRDIASLVSDLQLRVLNAAPFENRWWRFTANQGTGFTDEMRMHIAWDISPSPSSDGLKTITLVLSGFKNRKFLESHDLTSARQAVRVSMAKLVFLVKGK